MTTPGEYDLVEESDRGCVLLGAAILEERIEEVFCLAFDRNGISKKLQKSLFGSNGPLSTFSSKIKLAYSFGFVPKHVYEDLDAIRRIRNDFAHTSQEVDFLKSDTAETIENLNCTQEVKDKMPRYSPSSGETASEAELRVAGYIKRAKSLFALGVRSLEVDLLRAQAALGKGPCA